MSNQGTSLATGGIAGTADGRSVTTGGGAGSRPRSYIPVVVGAAIANLLRFSFGFFDRIRGAISGTGIGAISVSGHCARSIPLSGECGGIAVSGYCARAISLSGGCSE